MKKIKIPNIDGKFPSRSSAACREMTFFNEEPEKMKTFVKPPGMSRSLSREAILKQKANMRRFFQRDFS